MYFFSLLCVLYHYFLIMVQAEDKHIGQGVWFMVKTYEAMV